MNLANLDLNLLKVLNVLIEERSVTRAGERLGRTQPAISNALSRLRQILEDDLFVRGPDGLALTTRTEAIRQPLRELISLAEVCFTEVARFEPSTATGEFRIAMPNRLSMSILPPLVDLLTVVAPKMSLHVVNADRAQALGLLADDEIDLALGMFEQPASNLNTQLLFKEDFAVLCRRGHPYLGKDAANDLTSLLSYPHLVVSSTGQRKGIFDELLAREGKERMVQVSVSNFSTVPDLLKRSDMVGVFLHRAAVFFQQSFKLEMRPVPMNIKGIPTKMAWHGRNQKDQRHSWFRSQVRDVTRGLDPD